MGDVVRLGPRRAAPPTTEPEPLWREVVGRRLREARLARRERLADTAAAAGISTQYLSEIERGRKEPSSEILAAVSGALGLTLLDLTEHVSGDLRRAAAPSMPRGPLALARAV
ncbi:helix-turn-helix domain-containing protein [Mumia zhuanghuii]|uniref:Helix-turn-helix transcriptional regulator n=1 Tax=Mumia zhuanghuii TaxID=2585211 RepID=A0A5C4MB98_9ACTN|nr:helix-turn-helix transcriptional regulator [Mumia zhuanghuii]TNC33683.1 helix-turn-helix transcriptional regulator [Mumia zhuanghuii]TNC33939.1 helix-turn-helix transcriptional regulator [Mumia zhuanghuii]